MVAWIHQQADSHMLGAFVQMWCHPSKNMKITSQKQPKSIKHRRKGDCWSVLPAVPSLHSFPNWTRSSGRCGESPLPLTRPGVPLKKGPKIPISTAAHLIHDLSGLGKCPFLGLYFTLEKPMKGGLISVTNSYDLRKISSNQQISTDIPSNINRYQQINLDISGYFFTSPGNFSWFPPAARVVWGWPPKRFVRGFRWSPVASCAPVRFFFSAMAFLPKVRERRNSPNWAIFSKQLLIAVDWWKYLNWGEWRLYSISSGWLFDLSFFKQVERYHRYFIFLRYSIERNSTIDIWYFYRNH